jgi:hypothetical protein
VVVLGRMEQLRLRPSFKISSREPRLNYRKFLKKLIDFTPVLALHLRCDSVLQGPCPCVARFTPKDFAKPLVNGAPVAERKQSEAQTEGGPLVHRT